MQGTPSSHIENLGLHGPQFAQRLSDSMGKAESDSCAGFSEVKPQPFVGQTAERMSDEELDAAITRACTASEAWYSQFKHLDDLTCLDMAYHFMGIARQLQRLKWGRIA